MKPMTKREIEQINNKCSNNWKFDLLYFIYRNQKNLIKKVRMPDETGYFQFRLCYNNENQVTLNMREFRYFPAENVTVENTDRNIVLKENTYKKRNLHNLILSTLELNDNRLIALNNQ